MYLYIVRTNIVYIHIVAVYSIASYTQTIVLDQWAGSKNAFVEISKTAAVKKFAGE